MAQISNCLKLISKIDERDQDALVVRLDELQAQGVPAERAQIQAAIDVLTAVKGGAAPVARSAKRLPEELQFPEYKEGAMGEGGSYSNASIEAREAQYKKDGLVPVAAGGVGTIWVKRDEADFIAEHGFGRSHLNQSALHAYQIAAAGYDPEVKRQDFVDELTSNLGQDEADANAAFDKLRAAAMTAAPAVRSAPRPASLEIVEVDDGFDAMIDGKRVGRLRDNLPRGAAEQLDDNASVDIVKVDDEFKGQGVGSALYEAFSEKHGGRIAPSGKTSPEAWALWKRKFPEKVDAFVAAEAGRIADGADQSMVIRNISDPEVARRVAEAAPETVIRSASRQTDTPEFKRWFGDSKVVDADGKPLVVYHATTSDIKKFSTKKSTGGFYFTPNAEEAYPSKRGAMTSERGLNVMPAYLSITNPLRTSDPSDWHQLDAGRRSSIEARGFDGVIVENDDGSVREYIAFRPEQIKSATGNDGSFDADSADITRSATRPEFFSQLQRAIGQAPDRLAAMAAPQWKLWLDANASKMGIKKDEIEWSTVKDYLTLRGKDKVTRDELVAYLADSGVRVQEVVLQDGDWAVYDGEDNQYFGTRAEAVEYANEMGINVTDDTVFRGTNRAGGFGAKYGSYTVPGGENYREVLITLPGEAELRARMAAKYPDWGVQSFEDVFSPEDAAAFEKARSGSYKSDHWDKRNILAHLRVDDRVDSDGNKVLFINEIQSDWGQDGKKKGFNNAGLPPGHEVRKISVRNPLAGLGGNTAQAAERYAVFDNSGNKLTTDFQTDGGALSAFLADSKRVPLAPFVTDTKAWASLALKRAIMMAMEEGHDKIAIITGEQAADLYDLSRQVDMLSMDPAPGGYNITAWKSDEEVASKIVKDETEAADMIGKEQASKLFARKDNGHVELTGVDLKVGGEGMRAFYDQIIPQVARDVLKKLGGGQLQQVVFGGTNEENGRYAVVDSSTGETVFRTDSEKEAREYRLAYPEASRIAEMSDDAPSRQVAMGENPGFDITPAMRKKVASGVPLFSKGRTSTGADWESPSASKFDDLVYKFQDKQIDTKRVVEAIKEAAGAISDDLNVYLNEELYHGRAAKRTEDFINMELNPLIADMAKANMKIADLEEFLHARHAKEANAVIAQRNPGEPGLQDGGSGMMNSEADNYMATLPAADRAVLEAAAAKVDAIIGGTRKMFVDYELESQATVDGWNGMFKHYVPLQREDKEGNPGLGQGFSIKGKETKGRTGSTRKVVDILANIAMQRERAIVRGEKNRVAQSLVGLVRANENQDFWLVDEVPTERVFNPNTGLVEDRVDPMYKSRENAVVAKIKDPSGAVREHAVLFNEDDPRALRMAQALKNLDAQQLNGLLGVSAKITRYFAAVNTQYNPVFGVVNLVRDVQGAMLNLSSTPLKDDKAKIAKYTASALAGIYGDMRAARKGKNQTSQWATLWDEFQEVGGQTGYRDLFATSADRAEAIQKALDPNTWMDSKLGKVFTAGGALKVPVAQAQKQAGFIFDWLSDYNAAMENGVRLAAYKAGLERGMTKQQAASAAKNLTTNFNRKGQVAQQAGAMYAFFNAAIQGTARIGQTLFDMEPGKPKTLRLSAAGKKIVYGGIVLGSVQAMALAAAGFGEEDPPEFTRERSLIIPTGGKTYVSIPMPLGMHIIPNIGRVATEFVLSGFKDPIKRSIGLTAMFADAFNPIGNAGMSMQTLAPTALDPLVALTENKDWTGRPIAKTSFNKATPGHALGRDTATALSEVLSESINTLSGGNKYVAGVFSPTPDQIDYLLGQLTGGVGREYSKTEQTLKSVVRGESLPTYKIPLVGRFVGNAKGQASEGSAFYANVDKLNEIETEAKGLRQDGKDAEARKLLSENPEAYLITQANYAERQAQKLRRQKSELIKAGAPREQVKAVEEQITAVMARLNRAMERLKDSTEATAQ